MLLCITLEPGWCLTSPSRNWQLLSSWRFEKKSHLLEIPHSWYFSGGCSGLERRSYDWDLCDSLDGYQRYVGAGRPHQQLMLIMVSRSIMMSRLLLMLMSMSMLMLVFMSMDLTLMSGCTWNVSQSNTPRRRESSRWWTGSRRSTATPPPGSSSTPSRATSTWRAPGSPIQPGKKPGIFWVFIKKMTFQGQMCPFFGRLTWTFNQGKRCLL